jgi:hypothetical protein
MLGWLLEVWREPCSSSLGTLVGCVMAIGVLPRSVRPLGLVILGLMLGPMVNAGFSGCGHVAHGLHSLRSLGTFDHHHLVLVIGSVVRGGSAWG